MYENPAISKITFKLHEAIVASSQETFRQPTK